MLNFTSSERRVIIIISLVLIISAGFYYFRNSTVYEPAFDYRLSDSIFSRRSHQKAQMEVIDSVQMGNTVGRLLINQPKAPQVEKKWILNINTATAVEFARLPRIGPSIAKRIVDYRTENGPFRSVDDLMKVKGIGKKTLEKIIPYLRSPVE